ncbi:MAG: hypothetical protein HYX22_00430 [Candidatus Yanofskybacteria bacterium]|nr:hypothetical protein [Candidatus Yanofskybacteria bacterium]
MTHGTKTNKSLRKRVKITSSGKILKRYRQDYFHTPGKPGTRKKAGHKTAPRELIKSTKALLTRYL